MAVTVETKILKTLLEQSTLNIQNYKLILYMLNHMGLREAPEFAEIVKELEASNNRFMSEISDAVNLLTEKSDG